MRKSFKFKTALLHLNKNKFGISLKIFKMTQFQVNILSLRLLYVLFIGTVKPRDLSLRTDCLRQITNRTNVPDCRNAGQYVVCPLLRTYLLFLRCKQLVVAYAHFYLVSSKFKEQKTFWKSAEKEQMVF